MKSWYKNLQGSCREGGWNALFSVYDLCMFLHFSHTLHTSVYVCIVCVLVCIIYYVSV